MKKNRLLALALSLALLFTLAPVNLPVQAVSLDTTISSALRTEKMRAAGLADKLEHLKPDIDYIDGEILVTASSRQQATEIAESYHASVKHYSKHGFAVLSLDPDYSVVEAVDLGASESNALPVAYPDLINKTYGSVPNDPNLSEQYFHDLLDSYSAWDQTTGSSATTVAVIDTGIDTDHPEFEGRISTLSYNAYTNLVGISQVSDDIGHGTHVAGVIAAGQNNSTGISGLAPGVSLLVIKANMTGTGSFSLSDLIESIYYAVDNGADVINLSLGRPYDLGSYIYEQQAIQYAIDHGVTLVAAAGNESDDHAGYPAAYSQVIAVSAANSDAVFDAAYSNYGSEVDLCAPGTAILSTYPDDDYAFMSGTSMASPVVAGAAALLKSAEPDLTPAEISSRLYQSAVDHGSPGFDNLYGNGLINLTSVFSSPESGDSGVWGDFSYQTLSGEVMLTGYTGQSEVVDIPAEINGAPVTRIASSVLSNLPTARHIRFPQTIAAIDDTNLSDCPQLVSVYFAGDAPLLGSTILANSPLFEKIYHGTESNGFSDTWLGWPAESSPGAHTVTFRNWDGTILSSQSIQIFDSAVAPADPTRYKFTFVEWGRRFDFVTADLNVVAQYEDRPDPSVPRPELGDATIQMLPTGTADIKAIDVSQWQGPIDFSQVKTAVSTAYIRAASFKQINSVWTFYQDTALATNATNAKANGLNFGFYIYYRPQATTALSVSYAQQFYSIIKNYTYNCVPVIDVEETSGLSKAQITASVKAFADELKRLSGVNPMIYSSVYFANTYLGTELSSFKFWVAHWYVKEPSQTTTWPKWDMWQYSATGTVPGISGDVDLDWATRNVFAIDLSAKVLGNDSVGLTWTDIPMATNYEIYRSTTATGTYSLVGTTDGSTFDVSQLTAGTLYYFKVVMVVSGVRRIASTVASARPVSLTVTGLKAAAAGYDKVKLTWSTLSGASGYVVYRQEEGEWTEIGRTTAPVVTYTDTGRTTGTAYTYAVKAVSSTGVVGADYSASASATPIPQTVTGLKAISGGFDRIELSWTRETPADIATTYSVYRATSSGGTYSIVGTTTAAIYTDTTVVTGKTYYYKVRAQVNSVLSPALSSYVAGKALPAAPSDLTAEGGVSQAILTWTAAEGATGYQVYRATSPAGSYSLVDTTSNLTYTNTGLTAGVTYYYKVRSYTRVGTTNIYGTVYSNLVSATPDLGTVTGLVATAASASSIRLSWPAVANATKYEIYETDADGVVAEGAMPTASTSSTTWTHSGLVAGEEHYYIARAVRVAGALTIRSLQDSAVVHSHAGPLKVLGLKAASAGYDQVKLTWSTLSGAAGYVVYRQVAGEWIEIGRTTAPVVTYTETGLTTGTAYTYAVKAVSSTGVVSADYSASATAAPIPLTVTGLKAISGGYTQVELSWTRETPADIETTYTMYRAVSSSGTYSVIGTTTDSSYIDTTVVTGKTYYYKVRAQINDSQSPALSGSVAGKALPVAPTDLTIVGGVRQASLNWVVADGATGYQVYRATSLAGSYGLVGTTSNLTLTNTGLTAGVTYYYKVRSYTRVGTTNIYGTVYSNIVSVTPDLGDVTGLIATAASASSIRVSWPAVTNATKYEIYETNVDGGEKRLAGTTSYLSWTHSGLVAGEEHYYVVQAVRISGLVTIRSLNDSVVVHSHAGPLKVTGLKAASAGYDKVKLNWSALSGAAGYVVYRQVAGDWTEIGRTTVPVVTYTETSLTTGTAYTYAVKAVSSTGVVSADYSASATAAPIPLTVTGLKATATNENGIALTWTRETPDEVVTTFSVYRAATSFGPFNKIGESQTSTYGDADLTLGKLYYYKVKVSVKGVENPVYSLTASGQTIPKSPTGLVISSADQTLALAWNANNESNLSGYTIEYKKSTDLTWVTKSVTKNQLSLTINGLTNGTSYQVRMRAKDTLGYYSQFSDEVTQVVQSDFTYTVASSHTTIMGYQGVGGSIVIPSLLGGYPVVKIGDNAFQLQDQITGIIFPSTLVNIGQNAFYGCDGITSLTLPSTVTHIGQNAFSYCTQLTSVNLPSRLQVLDDSFRNCVSLEKVTIPEGTLDISGAFKNCSSLTETNIPSTVTFMGGAFAGCTNLVTISLAPGLKKIGYGTFAGCSQLTNVMIPNTVIEIGGDCFYGCKLGELVIPDSVTYISSNAFRSSGITRLTVPGSVSTWGDTVFEGCSSLVELILRDGLLKICGETFEFCTSLTEVTIPSSVIEIQGEAFTNCTSLARVTFEGNAPTIGFNAFGSCSPDLTLYYYPSKVGFTTPIWNGYPTLPLEG